MLKLNNVLWIVFVWATIPSVHAQTLVSAEYLGERSKANLLAQFGPLVQNGVKLYKVTYTTLDAFEQPDTASGLVATPVREGEWGYPMLCFQHGTVDSRADVPSNLRGGYEAGLVFGGMGYIALLPDFLGLGESRGFHPYVHAATEASVAVNMLRAVRSFVETLDGIQLNSEEQVFVCGYSQGGHAAMALQRSLELEHAEEFNLVASAPMSGPYSISGAMIERLTADEEYFYPAYIPNTFLSYNDVYGLYDSIQQAFKEPYAGLIGQYYREEVTLSELNDTLIKTLTLLEGASKATFMIQDSLVGAILNQPDHPVNAALRDNDVYNWAPQVPTRLYYCMSDDQVVYTNSVLADSVMNANGAPNLEAIDVNPAADHGGCVEPAFIATILFFLQYQEAAVINGTAGPAAAEIEVGPVPAAAFVQVRNAPQGAEALLYGPNGVLVKSQTLANDGAPIELGGLPSGMYYLVLRKADWMVVKRVVKS